MPPHTTVGLLLKKTENKSVGRDAEKRELLCTVSGDVNWCLHHMEVPLKIKNRATLRSNNSTSGYFLKANEKVIRKNICTPMFIAALSTIAKIWKQPKCALLDERIKKLQHVQLYIHIHIAVVCIHSEILLSH